MDGGGESSWLEARREGDVYRRVEVITGRRRRRSWSEEEKRHLVALANEPGSSISEVARRAGVNRSLLNQWRRAFADAAPRAGRFVPVEVDGPDAGKRAVVARRHDAVIEIDVALGRLVIRGAADPALACAVLGALRERS